MRLKNFFLVSVIAIAYVFTAAQAYSDTQSVIRKNFIDALETNDGVKMYSIVETNKEGIPAEVRALIEEAKNAKENQTGLFYAAEMMARQYMEVTGDTAYLIEVKKADFESRLTPPVRAVAVDGVHTVEFPKTDAAAQKTFRPDNIIIKKGETVRWVNKDEIEHVFSTMQLIGKKGVKSPSIDPGKSWEFKFEEAGEYYYLCFIHRGMISKVTVEEQQAVDRK